MGRINEVLQFDHQDDEPFLWPELFLFRGVGADLIRGRPAAALSLAERLAHPCCLIGTAVLLTRASYRDGKQAVSTLRCGDCRLSSVRPKEKTRRSCSGEHLTH